MGCILATVDIDCTEGEEVYFYHSVSICMELRYFNLNTLYSILASHIVFQLVQIKQNKQMGIFHQQRQSCLSHVALRSPRWHGTINL